MKIPNVLTVAAVPLKSIFDISYSSNGTVVVEGGTDARIFDLLSKALHFEYKVVTPKDGSWGDLMDNGSWSGAIGMVLRKEADLAIGKIGITEDRASVLDYSYPYDIETLTFATQIPGLVPTYTAVLWPFSWKMWICVCVLVVTLTVAFRRLLSTRYTHQELTVKIIGNLVHQQLGIKPETCSDKLMLSGWLLGSMLISFSYTAVLLAFLSIPRRSRGLRDLYDLSSAVCEGNYRCLTFEGDSHTEIFLRSSDPSVRCMASLMQKNKWKIVPLRQFVGEAVSDGRTAVVAPAYFFTRFMQNQVFTPEESLSSLTRSIFFRKDFCCKELLDRYIHIVTAAGFYHKYLRFQLFLARLEPEAIPPVQEEALRSLTLTDLSCAFILLAGGLIISSVACCVEVWYHRKHHRSKLKIHRSKLDIVS